MSTTASFMKGPTVYATGLNDDVPFEVDVKGVAKVKLFFDIEGVRTAPRYGGIRIRQLGVENLGLD